MAKATGIGGVFFRSRDTAALAAWYEEHLGVNSRWMQEAGMTVFAPFEAKSDYFPADKQWMINFRVDDLDGSLGIYELDALYRLRPNISFALGYSMFKASLVSAQTKQAGSFNFNSKGPEFFVRIAF